MCRHKELLTWVAFEHLRHLPSLVGAFKDWRRFLIDYLPRGRGAVYSLRNGVKILTTEPQDVATLAVVFAKREYGTVPRTQ